MNAWPGHAHTAADREHAGREGVALTELLAKWTGCWCGEQQYPDHDPRVRDCPQHGSDDCRHMAEGIATDLARLAAQPVPAPSRTEAEVKAEGWDECVQALAWCLDNGPADAAPDYLRRHNPYRDAQPTDGVS